MGLTTAFSAAVSALDGQSSRISAISDNLSNTTTTAYKTKDVSFSELITGSGAGSGGGVTYQTNANVEEQGEISSTSTSTNIALDGGGFFIVTSNIANQSSADVFTRDGSFSTDNNGYLINDEGQYLLGQPTDSSGNIIGSASDINSLQPINVGTIKGSASPSTAISLGANLPADAATNSSFTTTTEVFDALGVSSTVTETWTKTAADTWTLGLSNPVLTSNPTETTGTISPATISITFNGDGSIKTPTSASTVTISNWTTGASNSSIALNLGTPGTDNGLTQFSSTQSGQGVTITSTANNGVRFGKLSAITITSSGLVTAKFDNGLSQPVYQIPIATFADANALEEQSGSVYADNSQAGIPVLQDPGEGNAGTISSSALEGSASDTAQSLTELVDAQNAYDAASKIISTVTAMYTSLVQAV